MSSTQRVPLRHREARFLSGVLSLSKGASEASGRRAGPTHEETACALGEAVCPCQVTGEAGPMLAMTKQVYPKQKRSTQLLSRS